MCWASLAFGICVSPVHLVEVVVMTLSARLEALVLIRTLKIEWATMHPRNTIAGFYSTVRGTYTRAPPASR